MAFELPSQRKSDFPWWQVVGVMIVIAAAIGLYTWRAHGRIDAAQMRQDVEQGLRPGPREEYLQHQRELEQRVERSSDPALLDDKRGSGR